MSAGFAGRYGPWALVAGASEGIGAAFCRRLAERGLNIAMLSRRAGPLHDLAEDLKRTSGVQVRVGHVDLTAPDILEQVESVVGGLDVGLLVYNAGAERLAAPFTERMVDDELFLIDINCRAPVLLAHRLAPSMATRGRGGMIFITSGSALAGAAYQSVYNASKAFELVLAEGLWMDLGQHGVDVVAIMAGLTDTPAMRRVGVVGDDEPPFPMMTADAVAVEALEALGRGPVHLSGDIDGSIQQAIWPRPRADSIAESTAGSAVLWRLPTLKPPKAREHTLEG